MSEDNHDLLNGRINVRAYFERILLEFKQTLAERNARLDERFEAQEKAIDKAEKRLDSTLQGFPQEYARKVEMEQMRIDLANTASVLADKVVDSAKALALSQDKVTERQDGRLSALEKFQSKLLGLALAMPFVSLLTFWLITRH